MNVPNLIRFMAGGVPFLAFGAQNSQHGQRAIYAYHVVQRVEPIPRSREMVIKDFHPFNLIQVVLSPARGLLIVGRSQIPSYEYITLC